MNNERPTVSQKNKYYISKHKYYELKHFCLQYPEWKKERSCILSSLLYSSSNQTGVHQILIDPTSNSAEKLLECDEKIELIERISKICTDDLSNYILKGVTEGKSYTTLRTKYDIPCCKDTYYELYRRFYWLLSKER